MKKLAILALALSAAACTSLNLGGGMKDGTYTAKMATDSRGWTPKMTLTVKGGKITGAVVDNVNKDGILKRNDAEYNKNWEAKSKTNAKVAADELQVRALATQKMPVDTVAGATSLTMQFNAMGEALVAKAMKGDTKEVIVSGLKDGKYMAKMATDSRGWTPQMTLVVEKGEIVSAVVDNVNKDGGLKRNDAAYNANWEAKSKTNAKVAADALEMKMLATQKAPVDVVAGATGLSGQFNDMAKALLKNAQTGKTELTMVEPTPAPAPAAAPAATPAATK